MPDDPVRAGPSRRGRRPVPPVTPVAMVDPTIVATAVLSGAVVGHVTYPVFNAVRIALEQMSTAVEQDVEETESQT